MLLTEGLKIHNFMFQTPEMSDSHIRQICREILHCEYDYCLTDGAFLCFQWTCDFFFTLNHPSRAAFIPDWQTAKQLQHVSKSAWISWSYRTTRASGTQGSTWNKWSAGTARTPWTAGASRYKWTERSPHHIQYNLLLMLFCSVGLTGVLVFEGEPGINGEKGSPGRTATGDQGPPGPPGM